MNLIKWTPRRGLMRPSGFDSWADDVDHLLDSFSRWPMQLTGSRDSDWLPSFDVLEREKDYQIRLEAPGMDKSDFHVAAKEGMVTVTGEKKDVESENGDHYTYRESRYGKFCRSFRLPEDVTGKNIKATYKDGVLTVTLPRTKPEKTKELEVKVE